jgi:hypothetical protein
MILDTQTIFSGAIAADGTRSAQGPVTATAISTNVLDRAGNLALFPTLEDEGLVEQHLYLVVQVLQAFNNLTSLTVTLESDTAAGLATAPVVHFSKTILLAALTAGATVVRVQLPSDDYKRYIGVRYTVTGTAPTTGTVYAFLTENVQRNVIYPGNFTIDA